MFWKVGDKGFDCVHTSLVPLDSLLHGQWHGRNRARDRPSQGKDGGRDVSAWSKADSAKESHLNWKLDKGNIKKVS